MIHDIIPMPINVPSTAAVEMESPMFLGPAGSDDSIYPLGRNINGDYGSMFRYKIIEQAPCAWIERTVVSFDELDLVSLRLCNPTKTFSKRLGPIHLYPITTKIHEITSAGTNVRAYRHFSSIKAVLKKLCGMETRDLFSIHHLFLNAVATSLWEYNCLDYSDALLEYSEANKIRLKAVMNASDEENSVLISNMNSLANHEMFELFSDDKLEFIELVESWCRLPVVAPYDRFTQWMGTRPWFDSDMLQHHLAPSYGCRKFSVNITTQDIFDVEHRVNYHCHRDHRWEIAPLVNLLELLPYTDLSLEYGINGMQVHYAISMFGPVQEFRTMMLKNLIGTNNETMCNVGTRVLDLEIILYQFVIDEGISHDPHSVEISLVKTFSEEVFLNIRNPDTNKNYRYYFDLTLFALGSKGIVDFALFNAITSQGSPFWTKMNELRMGV